MSTPAIGVSAHSNSPLSSWAQSEAVLGEDSEYPPAASMPGEAARRPALSDASASSRLACAVAVGDSLHAETRRSTSGTAAKGRRAAGRMGLTWLLGGRGLPLPAADPVDRTPRFPYPG